MSGSNFDIEQSKSEIARIEYLLTLDDKALEDEFVSEIREKFKNPKMVKAVRDSMQHILDSSRNLVAIADVLEKLKKNEEAMKDISTLAESLEKAVSLGDCIDELKTIKRTGRKPKT